jgi:bacillithiol biosynthesis deacetylase BshB1
MDTKLPIDQHVDILAIGSHPIDVEIGVGGILLKMAHRGYTTVICDLTQGKIHPVQNEKENCEEAKKAARILHVSDRVNLALGNSLFDLGIEQAQILAEYLCLYRPDVILTPSCQGSNPGQSLVNQLIHKSIHIAMSNKMGKICKPYSSSRLFYYPLTKPTIPQAIVNITSTFEGKIEAVKAYHSRFHEMPSTTSPFPVAYKDFIFHIESRARYFGSLINCRFGEGLNLDHPVPIEDICEFLSF